MKRKGPVTDLARYMKERTPPPEKKEYGVFVWTSTNRYPRAAAVRVFKRESAAEHFARGGLDLNYVVRPLTISSKE